MISLAPFFSSPSGDGEKKKCWEKEAEGAKAAFLKPGAQQLFDFRYTDSDSPSAIDTHQKQEKIGSRHHQAEVVDVSSLGRLAKVSPNFQT